MRVELLELLTECLLVTAEFADHLGLERAEGRLTRRLAKDKLHKVLEETLLVTVKDLLEKGLHIVIVGEAELIELI